MSTSHRPDRRAFLKASAAGLGLGLGGLGLLVSCKRSDPSSRPGRTSELVDVIERSEHAQVLERLMPHIQSGITPVELAAALFAAGTQHVVPRAQFSKEHHILLCIPALHQAGQVLPKARRWLPLLWAVDYFKWAQGEALARQVAPLGERPETALPAPGAAERAFQAAMDDFDGARAEAAMAALYRSDRERALENLRRYGSKDFRHIGHKAIHVASALATLALVGSDRGEAVVRSIALTLALHYDEEGRDPDAAWTHNQAQAARLPASWRQGAEHPGAVVQLLSTLRQAGPTDAADEVAGWLGRGVSTRSIWDAMFLSGAELMLNHPTAVEALHAVTASNAAYGAFAATRDDATARLLLLQNASRVADFHRYTAAWAIRRKKPAAHDVRIDELEPLQASGGAALDAVFADAGQPSTRLRAVQQAFAHLQATPGNARTLGARAAEVAVTRAVDTHDFKLWAAALEDHTRVSPAWRARYLAACTARFRGDAEPRHALADQLDALAARLG